MEIIKYLADKLAAEIGISPPAARGLIKLSIKDEFGPFIQLNKLTYDHFHKVLHNSLRNRLIKLKIYNYKAIVDIMINILKFNQSLITIAGV